MDCGSGCARWPRSTTAGVARCCIEYCGARGWRPTTSASNGSIARKDSRCADAAGANGEQPPTMNHTWAVDFVHDGLSDGRRFRALTVIDEYSQECLAI